MPAMNTLNRIQPSVWSMRVSGARRIRNENREKRKQGATRPVVERCSTGQARTPVTRWTLLLLVQQTDTLESHGADYCQALGAELIDRVLRRVVEDIIVAI